MKLTRSLLLDQMQEGQCYTATRLAQAFGKPTDIVRDLLHAMIEDGVVTKCDQPSRIVRFQRSAASLAGVEAELSEVADTLPTTVATFPVTRTFSGTMTDYDLNAHRMLAMLTRR
jgi:DNA-binding IclR family transcriptional regulator